MAASVAIVHGWSDSSESFGELRDFLLAHGHQAAQIWLGDYVSLDDDVRVEDVAKRMHAVLGAALARGQLAAPFDLIVHSTGGLVAREWIATFYPDGAGAPVKRIIMLAPANFGSRLAALGKSMIGRVAKGWNNWFQTGEQMLKSLELASPYQWELAHRDLFDPSGRETGPYGNGRIWPFVITGARGWTGGLREIVNEEGSDGTVRAAAANLNAYGMTIDFSTDAKKPKVSNWSRRAGALQFPFALLPQHDHGTITRPGRAAGPGGADKLGDCILAALKCDNHARYQTLAEEWSALTEATARLAHNEAARRALFPNDAPNAETFHQYMQLIVAARDDHGQPVDDFFLEFYAPLHKQDEDSVLFHREILEHVHPNTKQRAFRCLFIDRSDLMQRFYAAIPDPAARQVAMSVSAAALGRNVRYFDSTKTGAKGHVVVHESELEQREQLDARFHRNSTHLIDLILPRQPVDRVFRLSQ